jgi:hypothetical protein
MRLALSFKKRVMNYQQEHPDTAWPGTHVYPAQTLRLWIMSLVTLF